MVLRCESLELFAEVWPDVLGCCEELRLGNVDGADLAGPWVDVGEDLSMESLKVSEAVRSGDAGVVQLGKLGAGDVGLGHGQAVGVTDIELVPQYVGTGIDVGIGVGHVGILGQQRGGLDPGGNVRRRRRLEASACHAQR